MYTITAQKRDPEAKGKQLRRAGFVPCVIYGAGLPESLSVQIDRETARQLKRTKRNGSKVCIRLEGESYPTLIKDLEYDSLKDEIIHISFFVLDPEKKVNSVADIVLVNKEKVAGVLELIRTQVPHAALPEDLIDTVTVDLEGMPIGTAITVGDIPEFSSGRVELQTDAGSLVLRINDKKRGNLRADA